MDNSVPEYWTDLLIDVELQNNPASATTSPAGGSRLEFVVDVVVVVVETGGSAHLAVTTDTQVLHLTNVLHTHTHTHTHTRHQL